MILSFDMLVSVKSKTFSRNQEKKLTLICLFPKTMIVMQETAEKTLSGDTLLAVEKVTMKKPRTTVTLLATLSRACWIGLNMVRMIVMLMML